MRTHEQIIEDAGGAAATAKALDDDALVDARTIVDANTVKQWKRTSSIPAPYWKAVAAAGLASLDELADAAARKRSGAQQETGDAQPQEAAA